MSNEIALMREIAKLQDQIDALRTIEVGGVWQSYTPVWTAATTNPSIGNGTLSGRYCLIGKTVLAAIYVLFGSTTSAGTGAYSFTYPINPDNLNYVVGNWVVRDIGGSPYVGNVYASSSTFALYYNNSYVTNGSPFGFAQSDFMRINLFYEIA